MHNKYVVFTLEHFNDEIILNIIFLQFTQQHFMLVSQ